MVDLLLVNELALYTVTLQLLTVSNASPKVLLKAEVVRQGVLQQCKDAVVIQVLSLRATGSTYQFLLSITPLPPSHPQSDLPMTSNTDCM